MTTTAYTEPLRAAVVELTNRCNLRCPHCASNSGRSRPDELSTQQWLQILAELAELGCEEITLIGGEIFLHRRWLDIARQVAALGMRLAIVTNGLLITDRLYEQLLDLPLERLGISLDGASPMVYRAMRGVDGYERVWKLLERIRRDDKIAVNAVTTVSRVNLGDLPALYRQLRGTGIAWQVQMASSVSQRFDDRLLISPEQYATLCRQLSEWILALGEDNFIALMDDFGYYPLDPVYAGLHHQWGGCQAGLCLAGIRANGDVLGCLSLGDPFVEANLKDRSLVELWTDPTSFYCLRHKFDRLTGVCGNCPAAPVCRGGCSAMAWSATGDICDNPYCVRQQECRDLLTRIAS